MTEVMKAFDAYMEARAEAGHPDVVMWVVERDGLFYLHREDLFPLTLGDAKQAAESMWQAAFSLRNV